MGVIVSLHRVALGNVAGNGKCWIPKEWGRHACNRKAKWYVFPAGEGSLDSTQYSNLCANPCDVHLSKALLRSSAARKKKQEAKSE